MYFAEGCAEKGCQIFPKGDIHSNEVILHSEYLYYQQKLILFRAAAELLFILVKKL